MTAMLVLVQFIGQAVGLCVLRFQIARGRRAEDPDAWKIRAFPLVVVPQLLIFLFIFTTTDNWVFNGDDPILDLAVIFLLVGVVFFFGQQHCNNAWPFGDKVALPPEECSSPDLPGVKDTEEAAC